MTEIKSTAEENALKATGYPSFPINLLEIKRSVAAILSQFGRSGIFQEYTTHDISHVDDMLETVKWLIPPSTANNLTPGEWLMIVLSIYFHDMGLVVTEDEFANREKSGFTEFCNDKLFSNPGGADYAAKVHTLGEERGQRFLYEEFVRYNHGSRVKAWVEGRAGTDLGFAKAQIEEIDRLLRPLDDDFRKDLALVCESHNLDDLDDLVKYRVSQPYGNSDEETVNLQYCAAILRSVDLIQITRQRAPSVLYRLINPVDPISQAEWAKQNAVKRVRQKTALDREGNATQDVLSDTIEVFATFNSENGFFGLTSYLQYAEEQLSDTYNIVQKSRNKVTRTYEFPWRYVDDSNIQVIGFVKKPFGFEIDQAKILDLLTGHTLYNDSNVVVRELAQNAIDAVRLQFSKGSKTPETGGKVSVIWSSELEELTVIDNGTGMTQEIVENHLLKVGSSRYQDPKFKESNPEFSPISRFGIGVLSAFMVADTVEIITVSNDEAEARQISLRSVHGKYLIKLLDKNDPAVKAIGSHGTAFKLKFRSSARGIDVLDTVKNYIMFPRCEVSVTIDGGTPTQVGHISPKKALESYLADPLVLRWLGSAKTRVVERTIEGFTLAYALRYSSHFRDWRFISVAAFQHQGRETPRPPVATCVEGIVVEFELPGYRNTELLAVANATGKSAPKTNVARSSIESTDEQRRAVAKTFGIVFDEVTLEAARLQSDEGYSLTWATEELPYLMTPALGQRGPLPHPEALADAIAKVPMFLVEEDQKRSAKALSDLLSMGSFWTVDSLLTRSVEQFIREARAEVTAGELLVVSQGTSASLPSGAIMANAHSAEIVRNTIRSKFEIAHLAGRVEDRRLDLRWDIGKDKWLSRDDLRLQLYQVGNSDTYSALQFLQERFGNSSGRGGTFAAIGTVTCEGLDSYVGVRSHNGLYLLPGTPLASLFASTGEGTDDAIKKLVFFEALGSVHENMSEYTPATGERFFRTIEGNVPSSWLQGQDDLMLALESVSGTAKIFNPLGWLNRSPN